MENQFDMVVVGAGMVGAALALGLAKQGYRIALIEQQQPKIFDENNPPDLRISAISCSSVALLNELGVWNDAKAMRVTPYRGLETWEWDAAKVAFHSDEIGLPELGFMVENSVLQLALWQHVSANSNITLFCPDALATLNRDSDDIQWKMQLTGGAQLSTKIVLAADGANSQVRQWAGIGITGWEYRQKCMLIRVKREDNSTDTDVTWQQFFETGPRAFLPLYDNWASLVWYDTPARIDQLQKMPMSQLTDEIHQAFPSRLGRIEAQQAGSFPLIRRHAKQYVKNGIVLLGDAAHTINPLAGQGVNLGYRDVDAFLSVMRQAKEQGEVISADNVLQRYHAKRYLDNLAMQSGMDLFYAAFSRKPLPFKVIRNMALMAAERAGDIKKRVLKYSLGL